VIEGFAALFSRLDPNHEVVLQLLLTYIFGEIARAQASLAVVGGCKGAREKTLLVFPVHLFPIVKIYGHGSTAL
jgi:hypothetical protein